LILSFFFVQIRSRVWFVVSIFFKRQIWRLRKGTTSVGEELEEDDGQIWVCGRRCVRAGLGLVSVRRLRWKPIGVDEERSIVVDGEGRTYIFLGFRCFVCYFLDFSKTYKKD
jgi:hypothetical protein